MQEATARETILVVDDEPQVLVALEDLLSDDFLVLKSESAEKALHLVEQRPDIAVVVSDQRMPRMHGDELFKNLRGRFDAERILATGFADLTAVIRAVNEGQIFAYVTKPWDPGDLRIKIQRAADHFRLSRDLAQERKLLEDLMNSIPDAIYFKDTELKYQRVSTRTGRSFAHSRRKNARCCATTLPPSTRSPISRWTVSGAGSLRRKPPCATSREHQSAWSESHGT